MCDHGKYIHKIRFKDTGKSNNDGGDDGYTGIEFVCQNLEFTSLSPTYTYSGGGGSWSSFSSYNRFIYGMQARHGKH